MANVKINQHLVGRRRRGIVKLLVKKLWNWSPNRAKILSKFLAVNFDIAKRLRSVVPFGPCEVKLLAFGIFLWDYSQVAILSISDKKRCILPLLLLRGEATKVPLLSADTQPHIS